MDDGKGRSACNMSEIEGEGQIVEVRPEEPIRIKIRVLCADCQTEIPCDIDTIHDYEDVTVWVEATTLPHCSCIESVILDRLEKAGYGNTAIKDVDSQHEW